MAELYDRLSRLFAAGHARSDLDLIRTPWDEDDAEYRVSAVLAAITDRPSPGVLLIYRPHTMRSHAGHIAFPGGKVDPGESLEEAAVREAHEEMGIDPAVVRLVGRSDMLRTGTRFEMNPVVAVVPGDVVVRPSPVEVAEWFEAPLDHVFDPANHVMEPYTFSGRTYDVWTIRWDGHVIWGATAMILINLARRLNWVEATV